MIAPATAAPRGPIEYWPGTGTLSPELVRSVTRQATLDAGDGCGLARVLAPHLENLGADERLSVLQLWATQGASAELRSFAQQVPAGLPRFFLCVTPKGQWPDSPPSAGSPCFSGAQPRAWQMVEAGADGLIWLDDFVSAHDLELAEEIHLATPLPAPSAARSVRVRGAAADLRLAVVAAGVEVQSAPTVYRTGPVMDAPYDQFVFPLGTGVGDGGPWLYAIVTPSRAGATRFGARVAGANGEAISSPANVTTLKEPVLAALQSGFDGEETPAPPPHPCLPSRTPLMRAAFERALGLAQATNKLEALATTIPPTAAGVELALAILPAIHPDSAKHALLTRLEVDAPAALKPRINRTLAAIALDRAQPARAALLLNAAGPTPAGVVDGLRARLALAGGRTGEVADILSACATDRACPPPLVEALVRAQLDIGLVAEARAVVELHEAALLGQDGSTLWLDVHVGPPFRDAVTRYLRARSDQAPTRALLRIASARGHLRTGDRAGALAELERLQTPAGPTGWIVPSGTRIQLAELWIELGRLDEARAIVAATLAESPADPWARALADQLRARDSAGGDVPAAMQDIMRHLPDHMSGYFASPPSDLGILAKTPSRAPPEGWEVVSEQLIVKVAADGSASRLGRQILRRGPAGAGARPLAPLRWPWDPSRVALDLVRAVVHRPQLNADRTAGLSFVSQPLRGVSVESPDRSQVGLYYDELALIVPWTGVPEDALLELVWIATPVGQPFPGYFEFNEFLSSRVPRRAFDLVLSAPAELPVAHRVIRSPLVSFEIQESLETKAGRAVLTIAVRDDPGLPAEPFAPPHAEVGAIIQATTVRSWSALGAYYASLMRGQARLNPQMREAVAAIIKANRGRSGQLNEADIAREIASLVARRVRYVAMEFGVHSYKPYRTEDVWARRFGDCKDQALLLVTLLNEAGIDAEPVLVRTRRLGHVGTADVAPLPMLALFDHAIVHLRARDLFIDPTTIHHGFDNLAPDNLGADALILPWGAEKEGRLTRIPGGVASRNRVDGDFGVILDADGSAIIQGRVAYSGTQAGAWRSRLANEATRDQLVQTMIASTFRGFELSRFTVSGLDEDASQLRIVFEGAVGQLAQREADGLRIASPLPLGGQRARVGLIEGRTLPFRLGTPGIGTFEVAWTLPPNHRAVRVPDGLVVESAEVRATVDWRAPDPTLEGPVTVTGHVELAFLTEQVLPASLPGLARILDSLDKAVGSPLILLHERPTQTGNR